MTRKNCFWMFAALLMVFCGLLRTARAEDLRFAILGDVKQIDWHFAPSLLEGEIIYNLMDGLVTLDKDLKVRPALAQSWKVSEDGKVYRFRIRDGVKWSDGVELNASDFEFAWKRALSPLTASTVAYQFFGIEGAEAFNQGKLKDFSQVGIKVLDSKTLEVRLRKSDLTWAARLVQWGFFPMRKDVLEKHGTDWARPGRIVTLGAFTLESHDHDAQIVLRANPKYWGVRKGNLQRVVGVVIPDEKTAFGQFEKGKLHVVSGYSMDPLSKWVKTSVFKVFPRAATDYLVFFVKKYPSDQLKFRKAVAMALNRKKIGARMDFGRTPTGSLIPWGMLGHLRAPLIPFSADGARAQFKALGLEEGGAIEFLAKDSSRWRKLGALVESTLRESLNANIQMRYLEPSEYERNVELQNGAGYLNGWVADFFDPDNFLSIFLSTSGDNRAKWENAVFDKWVRVAKEEADPRVREKLCRDAQEVLLERDAVVVPISHQSSTALVNGRVKGFSIDRMGKTFYKDLVLEGGL